MSKRSQIQQALDAITKKIDNLRAVEAELLAVVNAEKPRKPRAVKVKAEKASA